MVKKRFKDDDDLPWYRYRWAWFVWIGPAVVVVASFITLYIAIINRDSLVDPAYYKNSNKVYVDTTRQKTAILKGYKATVVLSPQLNEIRIIFEGPTPQPEKLNINLQHPTVPSWDVNLNLEKTGPNIYQAGIKLQKASHWFILLQDPDNPEWEIRGVWQTATGNSFQMDPSKTTY